MSYKFMGYGEGKLLYAIPAVPEVLEPPTPAVPASIGELAIPYGNGFTLTEAHETMTWEGDDALDEVFFAQVISGTLTWDKYESELLEKVFGKTAITAGIPAAEAERLYMGDDTELAPVEVGLQVDIKGKDDSTGVETWLRLTVFRCTMSPWTPPDLGNRAKWGGFQFQWKAIKTTRDLIAVALPSVPTNGASYAISILD
jgi:hypothetical protein